MYKYTILKLNWDSKSHHVEFLESILQPSAKVFHFGKAPQLKNAYLNFKNFTWKYKLLKNPFLRNSHF